MQLDAASFNELGSRMQEILTNRLTEAATAQWPTSNLEAAGAARDLSIARTHLEDALTRYNSARYRLNGTWKRADPDR